MKATELIKNYSFASGCILDMLSYLDRSAIN